ncbi:MAG: hypothetical protein AABX52_04330 [Nanoarchaeota archaeon]
MTRRSALMSRKEHETIIKKGIELEERLFSPLTLENIVIIENQLKVLLKQKKREYVAVPVGQPYGGPKRYMALPRDDVDVAHHAYISVLHGISPEIGMPYDLEAQRYRLENGGDISDPSHYPPQFLNFLSFHFNKRYK